MSELIMKNQVILWRNQQRDGDDASPQAILCRSNPRRVQVPLESFGVIPT
jgi:hypothetical protein